MFSTGNTVHAYSIHPLVLHFDKPSCLTIWAKGVTIIYQIALKYGPLY